MRLTLRTLLAYLDGILSPEDTQAMSEKLEENEFAQGLVHRIQSSMKRLRLGAPKLDGKGMGMDPNTVAEFLDNSLPPERMQEFEKVCLESDVHLAEVAASHQILTLVLGERAEVPDELRKKMHALTPRPTAPIEAPATPAAAVATLSSEPPPVKPLVQTRPDVPDYLKAAHRTRWQPLIATAALVLLLLAIALLAMGDLDESHPILGAFFRTPAAEQVAVDDSQRSADVAADDTSKAARQDPGRRTAADDQGAAVGDDAADESTAAESAAASAAAVDANAEIPATDEDVPPSEPTPDDESVAASDQANGTLADVPGGEQAAAVRAASNEVIASSANVEGSVPQPPPPPMDPAADESVADSAAPSSPMPPAEGAAEADSPAIEVGRFIAGERDHVVARLDDSSAAWYRMPTRAVLSAGQQLLVLPSYRPQLALSSGIHCTLVGPMSMGLDRPNSMGVPALKLQRGLVLLDTTGIAGAQVVIEIPNLRGMMTFATVDSALAMDVQPLRPLGQDPAVVEPVYSCLVHVMSGQLTWDDGQGSPLVLQSGQSVLLAAGVPHEVHDDVAPPWAKANEMREIDLRASRELASMLDYERPLGLALAEQIGHRQIEVSALARECLGQLDEFEPMVLALSNERHHAYWKTYFDALVLGVTRGADSAAKVRGALAKVRPAEADAMYRMLWGYTDEQLENQSAMQLVNYLESPVMEVRVLAFENLRRITNRTHLYRPEREPIQQRKVLQDWRNTLSRGLIRSAAAESPSAE